MGVGLMGFVGFVFFFFFPVVVVTGSELQAAGFLFVVEVL